METVMDATPWDQPATLLRRTGAGEEVEAQGILHQLVGSFLEMAPEQQQGLYIRVTGGGDSHTFDEAAIRELAAHPDFTGAIGTRDTIGDGDEPDLRDAPDELSIDEGVSGPAQR
jgi:hypothetical protein